MLDKLSSQKICFAYTVAYLILTFFIFITFTTHSKAVTLCSYAVSVFGVVIIVACIIKKKFNFDMLLLSSVIFVISSIISSIIFLRYGGVSTNLKGLIWLTMELILIFNVIHNNYTFKYPKIFIKIFITISTILAILSLGFAIFGYGYIATFNGENGYYMGMLSGRLYGMYSDPYYGSVISVIAILGTIYLFKKKFIYSIIISIPHLFVIALSGSRTTIVIFCAGTAILVFFLLWKNKKILSIVCSIITAIAIFTISIAVTNIYSYTEPYILKSLGGPISDPSQIFPVDYANKVNDILGYTSSTTQIETNQQNELLQNSNKQLDPINPTSQVQDGKVEADNVGIMGRDETNDISNKRFLLWSQAIDVWKTSPVIGIGFRNVANYTKTFFPQYDYLSAIKSTHNIFIDVLMSQGILGIASLFFLLVLILIMLLKNYKINFFSSSFAIALFSILLIASLLYPEMLYVNTPSACIMWYILGAERNLQVNNKVDLLKGEVK